MDRPDEMSADRLREELVTFARLLLRLERDGTLLSSPADLQRLLGDLRRKLFAWEVRGVRLLPPGEDTRTEPGPDETSRSGSTDEEGNDAGLRASLRVVREALRREQEMIREWEGLTDDREDEGD